MRSVTGCGMIIIGMAVLFVVAVVAISMFSDDETTTGTTSPGTTSQSSGSSTTLHGRVALVGSQHFTVSGNVCTGHGQYAELYEGSEVSITGRSNESITELSSGSLNDDGHCVFTFSAPTYTSSEYMFGFDGELYTQCPESHVPTSGNRIDASLQFGGDNRYCLRP